VDAAPAAPTAPVESPAKTTADLDTIVATPPPAAPGDVGQTLPG
jgi:hypothetical protein